MKILSGCLFVVLTVLCLPLRAATTEIAQPQARRWWYCHGYVGPCKSEGDEDANNFRRCEHGFGKGRTKGEAQKDTITNCETTLNANGGPWTCAASSVLRMHCEQEKR